MFNLNQFIPRSKPFFHPKYVCFNAPTRIYMQYWYPYVSNIWGWLFNFQMQKIKWVRVRRFTYNRFLVFSLGTTFHSILVTNVFFLMHRISDLDKVQSLLLLNFNCQNLVTLYSTIKIYFINTCINPI